MSEQSQEAEKRREELKEFAFSAIEEITKRRDESDEAAKRLIKDALEPLRDLLPAASNLATNPDSMRGQWRTVFSHFGTNHTTGSMPPCVAPLSRLSLGYLKGGELMLVNSIQEVEPSTKTLNNIMLVESLPIEGVPKVAAHLILHGRYEIADTTGSTTTTTGDDGRHNEANLLVTFYQIKLASPHHNEAQLRTAFGVEGPLQVSFSTLFPATSRMVYMDDDTRVQYGMAGGVYVLKRTFAAQGISTHFLHDLPSATTTVG